MPVPALLLAALWLAPAQNAPHAQNHAHAAHAAAHEEAKTPAAPLTAAELQQKIEADLHAGMFAGDTVTASIEGKDITLKGEVHSAEHKGVATREARKLAEKAGWSGYHVFNQIEVQLPGH